MFVLLQTQKYTEQMSSLAQMCSNRGSGTLLHKVLKEVEVIAQYANIMHL